MGNPGKRDHERLGEAGDALSLRSNASGLGRHENENLGAGSSSRYHGLDNDGHNDDDDVPQLGVDDDLPPLYSEVADSDALLPPRQRAAASASYDPNLSEPVAPFAVDQLSGAETYIDPRLDGSPELLEAHVKTWARRPPRLCVQIHGYHSEEQETNGKKERKDVTDFDVRVDLTQYLYQDVRTLSSWSHIRTVESGERVRRGTIFPCRAPGAKGGVSLDEPTKPSLREWVHRYCAGSSSGLKAFVLRRRVVGLDRELLRDRLVELVRSTNYRGTVRVYFPCAGETVSVYNECRTNRWRATTWIIIFCYVTLTFLLMWPYLFFRTKRFETVFVEWPFSKPDGSGNRQFASLSESQIFGLWRQAIYSAVLSKRQCTLDQQDLINSHSQGTAPPPTGNAAVDAGLNFVMAGVQAMNEVNRQMGWGHDR